MIEHILDHFQMAAGQHRQTDQMHAFFQRRLSDLFRGQADTFVDDLEADIAPFDRDLLGTVAVALSLIHILRL